MQPEAPWRVGFIFDAASCSGCKACQVACKDKRGLGEGRLWRRVVEVSGGGWRQEGSAWVSDVFAYNLSIACNHCELPICVDACPSGAIIQRADGIVLIDEQRCLGCGYCAWACPYGAPQYDSRTGKMTKCTFCADDLELGRPPACVAACPLRSLDYGDLAKLKARQVALAEPFPLPEARLTRPAWAIQPHRETSRARPGMARVANREELSPVKAVKSEWPLIAFTLLAQTAVGAWVLLMIVQSWHASIGVIFRGLMVPVMAFLVGLSGLGLLISFLHLGTPLNAWRALTNWRTSWLSREVLLASAFTGLAALATTLVGFRSLPLAGNPALSRELAILTSLPGLGLVYCMGRVYRLRTVPVWNRWQTTATFFLTTFLLGSLTLMTTLVMLGSDRMSNAIAGGEIIINPWVPVLKGLVIVTALLSLTEIVIGWREIARMGLWREILSGVELLLALGLIFLAPLTALWTILVYATFILTAVNAILSRVLFYKRFSIFPSL